MSSTFGGHVPKIILYEFPWQPNIAESSMLSIEIGEVKASSSGNLIDIKY